VGREDPKRVPFPYQIGDKDVREAFEKKYAGAAEVPIFSDPRIVPTFHGVGPAILANRGVPFALARRKPRPSVGADDELSRQRAGRRRRRRRPS
jgi:hypothetical protein